MKKKDLLCMRRLNATSKMIKSAKEDILKKVTINTCWGPREDTRRKYQLYLRCRIEGGILKAALYYPDNLRAGGRLPSYEVFIDRGARRFITYDCINETWRNAKLDRLEWPHYVPTYLSAWISDADAKLAAEYLGSDKLGYEAILDYQLELRKEARIRQYKKETDAWDADLALTPALPKDWDRWVDKVGIPQNFIFYQYERRGAKTGYCTYCEQDVLLRGKPRHNKTGRCPCCHHKITYKAIGKLGRHIDTDEVCVYLIQPRPDGFIVREFWAGKWYLKKNLKSPERYCCEHWRTVYDVSLSPRTYLGFLQAVHHALDRWRPFLFLDGSQQHLQYAWQ